MDIKTLTNEIERLISPAVGSLGYELIETEYLNEHGRWILRLYIDLDEGNITLDDCTKVSRSVSALLDVEDIIPGRYYLEVSSPGVERPLKKVKDFEKYIGFIAKIRTKAKLDDRKNFKGMIKGVEGQTVLLEESNRIYKISIEEIHKARLQDTKFSGGN